MIKISPHAFYTLVMLLAFQPLTLANGSVFMSTEQTSRPLSTPKILIVSPSVTPYDFLSRVFFMDLFEYGIVCDVASTTKYLSMERNSYNIIVFSGYSNPEDPTSIKREAIKDVLSGRFLIFLGSQIFCKTNEAGVKVKSDYGLKTVLGLPEETPYWISILNVSLVASEYDDFFKENKALTFSKGMDYYKEIVEYGENKTTVYIKDKKNGLYFLITNSKGAWVSPGLAEYVHFGKLVAKVWFGDTSIRFGFSLDRKYGKPIFVLRVDADLGAEEGLKWLDDLSKTYRLKISIAALGKTINHLTAQYWKMIDKNELFEIGVHGYHHGTYQTDLKWEVTETYTQLASYGVNVTKLFMGWGDSSWNSSQLESLYQDGWIVHSSSGLARILRLNDYERLGIEIISGMAAAGNLTERRPVTIGYNGISDYKCAKLLNLNFTHENILCFQEASFRMLPFIMLIHDYSWQISYSNDFGPLKSQIEAFLAWIRAQAVKSMWLSEYHLIYFDAHKGKIIMNGNVLTVTRPGSQANDVKIYVGSKNIYAKGNSLVTQRIVNGWLYVNLRPEETSTITLKELDEANAALTIKLYEVWEKIDAVQKKQFKSEEAKSLIQNAMQQYCNALNEFNKGRYDNIAKYLSEATKSLEQAFLAEEAYLRHLQIRPLILIMVIVTAAGLALLWHQFRRKQKLQPLKHARH